jgi:hypothetical protein
MTFSLFWNVAQYGLVLMYPSFGTTCGTIFKGKSTMRNIPEERRYQYELFTRHCHLKETHGNYLIKTNRAILCREVNAIYFESATKRMYTSCGDKTEFMNVRNWWYMYWPLSVRSANKLTNQNQWEAIPLQAWTDPEGSRRLRLPDFKTVGTWRWYGC